MEGVVRLARDHGGPTVTAVVLALLAAVPTVLTIFTSSGPAMAIDDIERLLPSPAQAVVIVVATLLAAALVSGTIGGVVRRRLRVTGAAVALVSAWLLGALLLPMVAAAIGAPLRTSVACFDTCSAMLDAATPTAGLLGVLLGIVLVIVTVVGGIVALLFTIAGMVLGIRHHATAAIACLVVSFGVLNLLSFFVVGGSAVPYLCLAIGVVAWDRWLASRVRAPGRTETLPMAEAAA